MSIPNHVPESSMEEILASIRKIISEDESKVVDANAAPAVPPLSRPNSAPANVSPLFADRRGPARFGVDRTGAASAKGAEGTPPADGGSKTPVDKLPAAESRIRPEAEISSPPRASEPAAKRQPGDRRLLSPGTEAAISESFAELRNETAREHPSEVAQLAEKLMRPMVKAWLDEHLPPLVERIVREEIERISRKR